MLPQHLVTSSHKSRGGNADVPLLKEGSAKDNALENIHTVIPDGVFTISNKVPQKALLFFLEVDMDTEAWVNKERGPGDVRQKIINYQTIFCTCHYKRYKKTFQS